MPFPISYSNTMILNRKKYQANPDALVRSVLVCLQVAEASKVNSDGNIISFKGGVRFVNSFNILLPITFGKITVNVVGDEIHIQYLLKFTQLLTLAVTAISIFFIPILLIKTELNLMEIVVIIFFCWLWICGTNYLVTILRFPRFLKKCIRQ